MKVMNALPLAALIAVIAAAGGCNVVTGAGDLMWDEPPQAGCAGCDAYDTFTILKGQCPNCSFNGSVVCGHYVNMSSKAFTGAAYGFSAGGAWEAIDFH